jgi:hypothetical protein
LRCFAEYAAYLRDGQVKAMLANRARLDGKPEPVVLPHRRKLLERVNAELRNRKGD